MFLESKMTNWIMRHIFGCSKLITQCNFCCHRQSGWINFDSISGAYDVLKFHGPCPHCGVGTQMVIEP